MKEIELINKRKKREKHFLQKDGTIIAKVYSDDIHYLKNGKYEEIDNTLKKENDYYTNKSNDYKVKFKEDGKDTLMQMIKDDNYINIKLKNANATKAKRIKNISNLAEDITYENVLDDINIEYKTLPTKIKETIVLKNSKKTEFTFTVKTNLILEKNNTYILAKKDGKTIFTIDSPYMEDANGEISYNVDYRLIEIKDGYELILSLDKEWLNAESRKYPVYVDPTITNQNQSGGMQDTYIHPGDIGIDRNSHSFLMAGVDNFTGVNRVNRTLIQFDLSTIGTGSEIVNASINLIGYIGVQDETVGKTFLASVHRITAPWSETNANWNAMHDKYDNKVEALIECKRSAYNSTTNELVPEVMEANITYLVKKWYKDTPNYGVLIKSVEEVYVGMNNPVFYSKDNKIIGESPKPILEITYRNQNGLEEYWDYKEQNITNGAFYVNTFNGNLIGDIAIGNTIGGTMSASLSLIYNTNDVVLNNNIGCGLGYRFNLNETIKEVKISNEDYLEYVDEDGTIHYFSKDFIKKDELFYDEDGLDLSIEMNESTCIMKDKNDNRKIFTKKTNETYYLTKIEDVNHNTIDILLDENNRITKIIDKNNASITVEYKENNIVVTSPNDTVTLNYTKNSLMSISSRDGTIYLTYNDKDIISTITDITGLSYTYEYYDKKPYRAKKIIEYGLNKTEGQSFTLEYGFNSTRIIDNKGRCETIMFNNYGNVISQNNLHSNEDIDGSYSLVQDYGHPTHNPNKLLSSSIPVGYIKNYLKNTSFEGETENFSLGDSDEEKIMMEFSNDYSNSGDKSLKITTKAAGQAAKYRVNVPKGKYYTFSGYFKSYDNAILTLYYGSKDGVKKSEEIIEYTKDFERYDVTIFYEEEATTELMIELSFPSIGVLYLDDIQLEEGEVANNYNFIENSDFSERISDWKLSASKNDSKKEVDATPFFEQVKFNNNKSTALKVKMNPLYTTSFSKDFNIKGKIGDLYTISFWYKNEGVEEFKQYAGSYVAIYFHPKDENQPGHCIVKSPNFNRNDEKWQYYSYRAKALEEFDKVSIIFTQNTNANNFYVTNLSFYKNITSGEYHYDLEGNVVSIENQSQEENIFQYDSKNQLIKATTPKGQNFKYEYDNQKTDRVLSAIASNGIANEIKYDNNGNPIRTKIAKKHNKEIENGQYQIRSKGTARYLKAKSHDIILEDNPCSNTIWNIEKQDDKYKMIYAVLPDTSIAQSNDSVILTKTNQNNLFTLEKNDNGSYCIRIGELDGVKYLRVKDNKLKFSYRNLEEYENSKDFEFYFELIEEAFMENSATYSEDGRFLTSVTDTNSNTLKYDVDPITGLSKAITDSNNHTTFYNYDNKNQLISTTSGTREVSYTYDDKNLLTKISEGSKEYNFSYDDFLNQKEVKIGDNIVLTTNNYESNNGNLLSTTYGNNHTISFDYDSFDRVRTVHKMDNDYNYRYDNNGNLFKVLSSSAKEAFYYDVSNRLYQYNYNDFKIRYLYNTHDDVISKKYQLNNTSHTLNNEINQDDLVTKVSIDDESFDYQYDSFGRVKEKRINNNFVTKYSYYNIGKRTTTRLESIENGNHKYSYQYDKVGNIKQLYYDDLLLKNYDYNEYDELVKEEDISSSRKTEYNYDQFGNLLSKKTKDLETDKVLDTINYSYQNSQWQDQLTDYNGKNMTYDEIGNLISIGENVTLNWINGRSLSSYRDVSKNITINYQYDKNGLRNSKIVNGKKIKYYLENNDIIYEERENDSIFYLYDLTGIAGLKYNGSVYYYVKNFQNDIIGILDDNYSQIVKYEYDSWGKVLSIKDENENEITDKDNIGWINPYRYRSYYYDIETELYYLNNRYYNPEWGRFINADGMVRVDDATVGNNLYAYANNNPILFADSNGNFAISMSIGTLVSAVLISAAAAMAIRPIVRETVGIVSNVIASAKTAIQSRVTATTKAKTTTSIKPQAPEPREHNVYVLREQATKIVRYVGRTKDKDATERRHKANPARTDLKFDPVVENVTKEEARGLEQMLIIDCRTLRRGNYMYNQINGVSAKNPKYKLYWDLALTFRDENVLPCRNGILK